MNYSAAPTSARACGIAALHATSTLPTEDMSPALDALSLKFAIATRHSKLTALDAGCGDGLVTAAALARGGHILAIDSDAHRLKQLLARVPSEQYARLRVRIGTLQQLDFKATHFAAVHAARVLHRLSPAELQQTLRKFFRWLYPEGQLFISAFTPAGRYWRAFSAEYAARNLRGEQWPGMIEDVSRYVACDDDAATSIHLLDEPVLRRELAHAGFIVEDLTCHEMQWDPDQSCCAVIARCGP